MGTYSDSAAFITERFGYLDERIRAAEDRGRLDRRELDGEIGTIKEEQAVLAEQVANLITAFRAARTAFYSLTVALIAATIVFLLTGK